MLGDTGSKSTSEKKMKPRNLAATLAVAAATTAAAPVARAVVITDDTTDTVATSQHPDGYTQDQYRKILAHVEVPSPQNAYEEAPTEISKSTGSKTKTLTRSLGNVDAELSYQRNEMKYRNVRLKIVRGGETILNRRLPRDSKYTRPFETKAGINDFSEIIVKDLDGDREPEVVTNLYTGGAHCCSYSLIYRYQPNQQQYQYSKHSWGNIGYSLEDLDQDNTPEFKSADDRFAYAFASFAGSGFPIQIWEYRQGEMIDVTRQYPQLIYNDAYQHWQAYKQARAGGRNPKGILAAYLADKYLLGQGDDGWQRLRQNYQKGDREQFFLKLQAFLREKGYISK